MSITKYNKSGSKFTATINEDAQYITLKELFTEYGNKVHKVQLFFINKKSRYGDHPVIYTGDWLVDIPKHMVDTFNAIYNDDKVIDDINNGRVGFNVVVYTKNHRQCYTIEFVDIF